jgi:hypothetical protein
VLLICLPAKTFEFVLSTADAGDWAGSRPGGQSGGEGDGAGRGGGGQRGGAGVGVGEEATLCTHIDQFLDILALFQNAAEAAHKEKQTRKKQQQEQGRGHGQEHGQGHGQGQAAPGGASLLGQEPARPKARRRSILQYSAGLDDADGDGDDVATDTDAAAVAAASAAADAAAAAAAAAADAATDVPDIPGGSDGGNGESKHPKFAPPAASGSASGPVTVTATSLAAASARREREALMLELLTSLSPELGFDDICERICRLTKEFFAVDRVGFFLVG